MLIARYHQNIGTYQNNDKMVWLEGRMLELHKQLQATNNRNDKTNRQREIEVTDRQIDQLAYELYGLTVEEIKIMVG